MPDLAIENGVVKLSVALTNLPEIDAKFDSFIADLQKKCNLKLTIDSTALDASYAAIASKIARAATENSRAMSKATRDAFSGKVGGSNLKAQSNWLTSEGTRLALSELNRLYSGYQKGVVSAAQMQEAVNNVNAAFKAEADAARQASSEVNRANKALASQRNRAIQSESNEFYRTWDRYIKQYEEAQARIAKGDYSSQASKDAVSSLKSVIDGYAEGTKGANDLKFAVEGVNAAFKAEADAARQASSDLQSMQSSLLKTLQGGNWLSAEQAKINNSYPNASAALRSQASAQLKILAGGDLAKVAAGDEQEITRLNAALQEYLSLIGRISKENQANNAFQDQATAIANLRKEYANYMAKFGENLRKNPELYKQFQQLGADIQGCVGPSNDLQRRFAELTAQSKAAGVEVETVRQRMTNLFGQHFNTALIMLAIRGLRMALRQLWQDIKEVNEALVQTQIVTGLSGAALEAYTDKAYAAAEKSRDKVTNILSESTAYGRLGYDSELSVQLAQLTSMYSKLGDVDTSDATDAITALMKAFDLKNADEIELALDKMIYVGKVIAQVYSNVRKAIGYIGQSRFGFFCKTEERRTIFENLAYSMY